MLKSGFARLDVTPPLGTIIAGYFEPRYASGVIDPIELNAVAFSDGENTSLLITFDALGMREMFCTEIRALIEERTGVPADHIILSCLHQHTSVVLRPKGGTCALTDGPYLDVLYHKFADVAKMAVDDLAESTLSYAEKELEHPISFVRRYIMKDGSVRTNPGFKHQAEIDRPAAEADNTVRLLRFAREGKNDIALVNFCTHPDVIGGSRFTADWPGFVRRFVEEDIPGVSCILVNGAQGDVNHVDFIGWKEMPAHHEGRYAHSRFMGRTVADAAEELWKCAAARTVDKVGGAIDEVFNLTRTDGAEDYAVCKQIYDEFQKTFKMPENAAFRDIAYVRRVVEMRTDPLFRKIPVTVLSLGDIVFVGFGGEPFTHYATAVREGAKDKTVISVCCANGFEGYLPTKLAFEQGGYEATASAFTPNLEEDCVKAALGIIKTL